MESPNGPLVGDGLLAAVTEVMVALHQRYHERNPVTAKTLMLGDDLLVCVIGGVYTDVEKTMIELQRTTIVQETRNGFQNAMQHKFIDSVQELSGRTVLAFISNHRIGPDVEIELFLLMPRLRAERAVVGAAWTESDGSFRAPRPRTLDTRYYDLTIRWTFSGLVGGVGVRATDRFVRRLASAARSRDC
jgi:uncharacterized protein YbcI